MSLLNKEPAVLIGVIAACILAVLQVLNGNGLVSDNLMTTITSAISPDQGGWLLPVIIGIVTRFFVYSPAKADELLHTPPPQD